jgi:hypothetical protein
MLHYTVYLIVSPVNRDITRHALSWNNIYCWFLSSPIPTYQVLSVHDKEKLSVYLKENKDQGEYIEEIEQTLQRLKESELYGRTMRFHTSDPEFSSNIKKYKDMDVQRDGNWPRICPSDNITAVRAITIQESNTCRPRPMD